MEHKGQTKKDWTDRTHIQGDWQGQPSQCLQCFSFSLIIWKGENLADQLNEVTWLSSHGTPWSQVSHSGPCHISEWYQNFDWSTYDHQDNMTISIKIRNTWKWLQSHGNHKKNNLYVWNTYCNMVGMEFLSIWRFLLVPIRVFIYF